MTASMDKSPAAATWHRKGDQAAPIAPLDTKAGSSNPVPAVIDRDGLSSLTIVAIRQMRPYEYALMCDRLLSATVETA